MALKEYRLKKDCGLHYDKHPVTGLEVEYKAGDLVQSHIDLVEKWQSKFEFVRDVPETPAPAATTTGTTTGAKITTSPVTTPVTPPAPVKVEPEPLGEDVSAEFPKVKPGGFQVFKKGKDYFVSEDGKTAINTSPLKKIEVDDFVADWLKKP